MFPLTYFVKKFVISPSSMICNCISWPKEALNCSTDSPCQHLNYV